MWNNAWRLFALIPALVLGQVALADDSFAPCLGETRDDLSKLELLHFEQPCCSRRDQQFRWGTGIHLHGGAIFQRLESRIVRWQNRDLGTGSKW